MRVIVKLLFLAGLAYFGHYMWNKTQADRAALAAEQGASESGFVRTGNLDESVPNVVLVLAPENCPSAEAQRALALDAELTRRHIPHTMGASMGISDDNPTEESVAEHNRAMAVFQQGAPAVYINGMGKSNPTADEVVAEYQRTRQKKKSA